MANFLRRGSADGWEVASISPSACRSLMNVARRRLAFESVVSELDIFISSAGNFNIMTLVRTEKLKRTACVGNTSHFENESTWLLRSLGEQENRQHRASEDLFRPPRSHGAIVLGSRFAERFDEKDGEIAHSCTRYGAHVPTQAQADFSVCSGGLEEGFRPKQFFPLFETSFSWFEMLVSEVALLGLSVVFSVVAMTAPTSALSIAPTINLSSTSIRPGIGCTLRMLNILRNSQDLSSPGVAQLLVS